MSINTIFCWLDVMLTLDNVPLPIPTEVDARLVAHREGRHAVNLDTVRVAQMILALCAFLREPSEVRAG
jgi:hypothetical protein